MSKKIFQQIKKEHPRVDVDYAENVFDQITQLSAKGKDVTISKVANAMNAKRSAIGTAFKWLLEYKLIKALGSGETIVFFRITNKKGEVEFRWGGAPDDEIEENLARFKVCNPSAYKELKRLQGDNLATYLKRQNELVKEQWRKTKTDDGLKTIELSSKAIRYALA